MKQWICVLCSLLVLGLVAGAPKTLSKDVEKTLEKSSEKTYPKKVTSLKKKPTKSPSTKSTLEAFKDLPEDDLEFIKELDNQFKLHGDKIKIKIERDNSTQKNSKRTVDGDLGYGYYNGQQSAGYDYPKPSFSFYPYSQEDISASAPGYHIKNEEESTISIIPSYSYEIKQNGGYETNEPLVQPGVHSETEAGQQYQQQDGGEQQGHGYQHNEGVIVLRIPGPTKYATHLQVLLQQYLEIRAAQYLRILEEVEQQKQQQQHQQYQQYQQLEQPQYEQVQEKPQEVQYQHQHQQEAPQNYEYTQQQQGVNYPDIQHVYQSFKSRHQAAPVDEQQYRDQEQYTQQQVTQEEPQQQYYYMQVNQEQPIHAPDDGQGYQPIYYVAMPQSEYGGTSIPQGYVDESRLPIAENNPRSTHTGVEFTEPDGRDHSTQYPLPSVKPFERHAPTTDAIYPQYSTQTDESGYQQPQQYPLHGESNTESVVSITQRPFNYHAHPAWSRNSKRNVNSTPTPTDDSSEKSLKKLHKMINRLRKPEIVTPKRTKKQTV